MPSTTSSFALTGRAAHKAEPRLIASDEDHFAVIEESLRQSITTLSERLDDLRRSPGGKGKQAVERDLEIHQATARLQTLRRYRLDLCLGRFVTRTGEVVYVGRVGLTDRDGRQHLVDWRSPAAEPFFAATYANPMGVVSRRRYRWAQGRVVDYWDEAFTAEAAAGDVTLDDDSALIAGLSAGRSTQMRDVLGTIQADQDAIIRSDSGGTLVVDGGPGTGKTVVALHRAAYLLYADPRLSGNRGGILVVGPHEPYLAYVADVLPSLGEQGVQTCTVRDLVDEGADAVDETDDEVARLKASRRWIEAIEAAARWYEEPPTERFVVETAWDEIELTSYDWRSVFDVVEPGTPHNEARDLVWEELVALVGSRHGSEVSSAALRRSLAENVELTKVVNRAWPLLRAADIVADLWAVPAFLRMCAPWLSADDLRKLHRDNPYTWTTADLPLLDAAYRRFGDPAESGRRRRRSAALAADRERMDRVVDDLLDSNAYDDGEGVMTMLRGEDLRNSLVDETVAPAAAPDALAGPFAHIIVDEAQELTDAQWQMVLSRCPSRSFTVVGDRAQARHGFTETWQERLERVGHRQVRTASLTINYRTPEEIMAVAEPVIRSAIADANVPTSIRSSGIPVVYGDAAARDSVLDSWSDDHHEGIACVIGDPDFEERYRVRSLSPSDAKGLEFDLVVLVDPEAFGSGIEGAVDRYVAMTRATQELVILSTPS
ncbi:RNA polymerase recycling motor ATPase HelR [Gordonia sp. CPCC 206044]|uniref:RNA polymerase recycling motor ATPase HelR n=1 Tax=Gordonia sp. CPCC 206044 TaxID=3140793 RepID=UPI003AF398B5